MVDQPVARRAASLFGAATAVTGLIALLLTYFRLSVAPMVYDETTYVNAAWIYIHGRITPVRKGKIISADNLEHPPLGKLLFGVAERLAGSPSTLAARLVSATLMLLAAVLLGWWIGRAVNRWAGLLTVLLTLSLPALYFPVNTPFVRTAMLDPVAGAFVIASLYASWQWFASSRLLRSSLWALLTGLSVGLATSSKENGFLGVVGPVLVGLVLSSRSLRRCAQRLGQTLAAAAVALGTFLLSYLMLGDTSQISARISYLWRFQRDQSSRGHLIGFDHRITDHPPWWTNLWFMQHALGVLVTLALVVAALAGALLRRDRLASWLAGAMAGPVLFHCFIAHVALNYYWIMWIPPGLALASIGIVELGRRVRSADSRPLAVLFAASAVVLLIAPAASVVRQIARVSTLRPAGGAALVAARHGRGLTGEIVASGVYSHEIGPYTSRARSDIVYVMPRSLAGVDTVVVGAPRCRTAQSRPVLALVATNLASGALQEIHSDRILTVYAVRQPLTYPTEAEIAKQPAELQITNWNTC